MAPQRRTHRRYWVFNSTKPRCRQLHTTHNVLSLLTNLVVMTKRPRTLKRAAWHLSAHWPRFECTTRGGLWLGRPSDGAYRYETRTSTKYGRATDRPWGVLTIIITLFVHKMVSLKTWQLTTHEQDRQGWLSTYSGLSKEKTTVARPIHTCGCVVIYDMHKLE